MKTFLRKILQFILTSRASSGNFEHKILLPHYTEVSVYDTGKEKTKRKNRLCLLAQGLIGRKDKGSQMCSVFLIHFSEAKSQEKKNIFLFVSGWRKIQIIWRLPWRVTTCYHERGSSCIRKMHLHRRPQIVSPAPSAMYTTEKRPISFYMPRSGVKNNSERALTL